MYSAARDLIHHLLWSAIHFLLKVGAFLPGKCLGFQPLVIHILYNLVPGSILLESRTDLFLVFRCFRFYIDPLSQYARVVVRIYLKIVLPNHGFMKKENNVSHGAKKP